jgi:hypothetical protein
MPNNTLTIALVTVLFVTVGLMAHAAAYIDLGTGSYLLQVIVAGLFGMIFSAKGLWARVRGTLGKTRDEKQ